jgi:SagB-type dehydrogenase family enzyme
VKLVLSRFACVRREGARLVAEDASARSVVELSDPPSFALLAAFAEPREVGDAAAASGLDPAAATELAGRLTDAGVLIEASAAAREEGSPWAFHDLLAHARVRPWLAPGGSSVPPAGALPPPRWEPTVELPRPDLDARERDDPPLARVQADRRSVRHYADAAVPLTALGEFLARVGRVHDVFDAAPGLRAMARPYPAAGALYELELYLAAGRCESVEPGVHHYVADRHALATVPGAAHEAARLLADAASAMAVQEPPPALVVIAARPDRLAWKYGTLSYTLVLKDVGVLLELMALSATAMDLGGCPLGTGDAAAFARATGLHRDQEASVGEFAFGVPAPGG